MAPPPLASASMKKGEPSAPSAAEKAEAVRVQRLREDARRPISVNLSETIALSHKLMRFAGSARRS
jgi:hypothetical protein